MSSGVGTVYVFTGHLTDGIISQLMKVIFDRCPLSISGQIPKMSFPKYFPNIMDSKETPRQLAFLSISSILFPFPNGPPRCRTIRGSSDANVRSHWSDSGSGEEEDFWRNVRARGQDVWQHVVRNHDSSPRNNNLKITNLSSM